MAGPGGLAVVSAGRIGRSTEAGQAAAVGLNGALDDARDEAAGQTHPVRVDLAGLDDLVDLDDGDARALGEARIEVL